MVQLLLEKWKASNFHIIIQEYLNYFYLHLSWHMLPIMFLARDSF